MCLDRRAPGGVHGANPGVPQGRASRVCWDSKGWRHDMAQEEKKAGAVGKVVLVIVLALIVAVGVFAGMVY